MPISEEKKQELRTRAASAKTQSKLDNVAKFNPQAAAYMDDMDRRLEQAVAARNVSRETSAPLPEYGSPASEPYLRNEEDDKDAGEHVPVGPIEHPTPVPEEESGGLEASVDDIPWNDGRPFQDVEVGTITSLVPLKEQAIVEGFTIPPGMDEDAVLDLSSAIYTYIGPIPVHIGRYTNKWFKVLGCCVQPLEGDVVDERTGEVEHIKWERPLFKLDKLDPDTGENIIAYGGGIRGLQIARHFNAISGQFGWTVGDFKRPRMFYVQQENRENAHVMYGFRHRACTDEEMK